MHTFSFIAGADCAGISGRLAEAIPGFRSMVNVRNYIDYPGDLDWNKELCVDLWNDADLIYTHHGFKSIRWALRTLRVPLKPFLIHFHGSSSLDMRERLRHTRELRQWPTARGIVSTLDLALRSGLPWLPSPMNVDLLQSYRHKPDGESLVIAHAPTNRALKSTAELIAAVKQLRVDGYDVQLDLIENVTWRECLRRKAGADIYFDQTVLGYGCNALEAWGLGMPVVAGADEATLQHMQDVIGYLPFKLADATEHSIYRALRDLLDSDSARQHWAAVGLDYLQEFHSYPATRKAWKELVADEWP